MPKPASSGFALLQQALAGHRQKHSRRDCRGVRHLGQRSGQRHQHARPAGSKANSMPNIKKKVYTAGDLREVSDNPELTKSDFAKAEPFAEALPDLAVSIRKGRGPNKAPTKKLFSLRLSGQVLEAYEAKGPGWQSQIEMIAATNS